MEMSVEPSVTRINTVRTSLISLPLSFDEEANTNGAYNSGSLLKILSKAEFQFSVLISPNKKMKKNEDKKKTVRCSLRRCHFSFQFHSAIQLAHKSNPPILMPKLDTGIEPANRSSENR